VTFCLAAIARAPVNGFLAGSDARVPSAERTVVNSHRQLNSIGRPQAFQRTFACITETIVTALGVTGQPETNVYLYLTFCDAVFHAPLCK